MAEQRCVFSGDEPTESGVMGQGCLALDPHVMPCPPASSSQNGGGISGDGQQWGCPT